MKLNIKTTLLTLAFAVVSISLNAETLEFSSSLSFPYIGYTGTLNLDQFDTLGGTRILDSVTLSLAGGVTQRAIYENNLFGAVTVFADSYGNITLTPPSGSAYTASVTGYVSPSVTLAASDGVFESGADYHDFGLLTAQFSASEMYVGSSMDSYIGLDTFAISIRQFAGWDVSGPGDAGVWLKDFSSFADVKVIYDYHTVPVPEPSSALLGIVAAGVFLLRRKRR